MSSSMGEASTASSATAPRATGTRTGSTTKGPTFEILLLFPCRGRGPLRSHSPPCHNRPPMSPLQLLALVAAAAGGGIMNAMAGGGTILVFPTLLFLAQPAISANATATVGLLPGAAASLFGYRREVSTHRTWLKTLFLPSLVGGTIGSVLLLRTPERT